MHDLRHDAVSGETITAELRRSEMKDISRVFLCRAILLTDSENCYASFLSGKSSAGERSVRIQLAYIRDMAEVVAVTFFDKQYNLTDSLSKTNGWRRVLISTFLKYGQFRLGFAGRSKR